MGTKSAWTPERRERQRQIIQQTKPWTNSTGPKTAEGKVRSSQNARMSREMSDAHAMTDYLRGGMLEIFGRKRWPSVSLKVPKR